MPQRISKNWQLCGQIARSGAEIAENQTRKHSASSASLRDPLPTHRQENSGGRVKACGAKIFKRVLLPSRWWIDGTAPIKPDGQLLYDVRMVANEIACRTSALFLLGCLVSGCGSNSQPLPAPDDLGQPGGIYDISPEDVAFLDDVESNHEDDGTVTDLEFVDADGNAFSLKQYQGKKNVLLVFTRGFSGELCPYCTTQTSRLIANYDQFTERETEVLLVYPGSKTQLPLFRQASIEASGEDSFPFPVLLDEDLTAVKRLGIAAQLAFPSSFIVDKQGQVRLSYVGSDPTDRPSIKALLATLDNLAS